MAAEHPENKESDERLYAVLLDFLESFERGHKPDNATLHADYPELAPELQAFLDTLVHLEGLTEPIRFVSQTLQRSPSGEVARPSAIESAEPHDPPALSTPTEQ